MNDQAKARPPAPATTPPAAPDAVQPRIRPISEHAITGVDGRELRLQVWTTPAAASASRLPAMLLLDGQWLSDTISQTLMQLTGTPMLVASLGFNTDERSRTAPWRARDYTPASPQARQCDPRNAAWPCGGADTLLALLRQDILPRLQRDYRADPARVALFGHSYAGLFSTYTWLRSPALFSHIYAASPSLWWYWPHALTLAAGAKPGSAGALPLLHLLVGADERWRPQPPEPDMPRPEGISTIPFAEQFLQALKRQHPQASTRLDILPDLAHGPMLHASAARCLLAFGASRAQG